MGVDNETIFDIADQDEIVLKKEEIKPAQELYEIAQTKAPEIVANILKDVRKHIIGRCKQEANSGATDYTIYLKKGLSFVKDLLLEECIKLAKEFEEKGYKVVISDSGNGYYVDLCMSFSWNGQEKSIYRGFGQPTVLYTTNKGVIKLLNREGE